VSDDVDQVISRIQNELASFDGSRHRKYGRFLVSALSSIPWVGGFIGASAAFHAEVEQGRVNNLQRQWIEQHQHKLDELGETLDEMMRRLDQLGEKVDERLSDESFLALVEQGFRTWDESATKEKRELIRLVLTNAGGTTLCSDDVVRLFLDWIDRYHELHFAVIREIQSNPGSTRADVWDALRGGRPREDSADADLFKLIFRELSMGGVIRQERDTTITGQFVKKRTRRPSTPLMKSAFDDNEPYVLTELGKQFVHYAMSDLVPRLSEPKTESQ
jgi:hypothetical protein